jgi:hypothetical protein
MADAGAKEASGKCGVDRLSGQQLLPDSDSEFAVCAEVAGMLLVCAV